jgi:hypothetical protein
LVAPWAQAFGLPAAPVRPLGLLLVDVPPEHKASAPPAAVSASQYEQTTSRAELRRQGCTAGRRNVVGLTILDFGNPAWNEHSYGTILFSERFASNEGITRTRTCSPVPRLS